MTKLVLNSFCTICDFIVCTYSTATRAAASHNMATADGAAGDERRRDKRDRLVIDHCEMEECGERMQRRDALDRRQFGGEIWNIETYSGRTEENLADWLRHLKISARLRRETADYFHLLAAAKLRGIAGSWFDSLPCEPKNFESFCRAIE